MVRVLLRLKGGDSATTTLMGAGAAACRSEKRSGAGSGLTSGCDGDVEDDVDDAGDVGGDDDDGGGDDEGVERVPTRVGAAILVERVRSNCSKRSRFMSMKRVRIW